MTTPDPLRDATLLLLLLRIGAIGPLPTNSALARREDRAVATIDLSNPVSPPRPEVTHFAIAACN